MRFFLLLATASVVALLAAPAAQAGDVELGIAVGHGRARGFVGVRLGEPAPRFVPAPVVTRPAPVLHPVPVAHADDCCETVVLPGRFVCREERVVEPAVYEDRCVPVFEERQVPVYETVEVPVFEDRCVPVVEEVCRPVFEVRLDARSGLRGRVRVGERVERVQVGERHERVQVGTRREVRQVGTRTERVQVGERHERVLVREERVRLVERREWVPGRTVTVCDGHHAHRPAGVVMTRAELRRERRAIERGASISFARRAERD